MGHCKPPFGLWNVLGMQAFQIQAPTRGTIGSVLDIQHLGRQTRGHSELQCCRGGFYCTPDVLAAAPVLPGCQPLSLVPKVSQRVQLWYRYAHPPPHVGNRNLGQLPHLCTNVYVYIYVAGAFVYSTTFFLMTSAT